MIMNWKRSAEFWTIEMFNDELVSFFTELADRIQSQSFLMQLSQKAIWKRWQIICLFNICSDNYLYRNDNWLILTIITKTKEWKRSKVYFRKKNNRLNAFHYVKDILQWVHILSFIVEQRKTLRKSDERGREMRIKRKKKISTE